MVVFKKESKIKNRLERIINFNNLDSILKKITPLTIASTLFFNSFSYADKYEYITKKIPYKKEIIKKSFIDYDLDAVQKEDKFYVYLDELLKNINVKRIYVKDIYVERRIWEEGNKKYLYSIPVVVLGTLGLASGIGYGIGGKSGLVVGISGSILPITIISAVLGANYISSKETKYEDKPLKELGVEISKEIPISKSDKIIKRTPFSGKIRFYSREIKVRPNPLNIKEGKGVAKMEVIESINGVISYTEFLKKPQVSMFKGMCNLKNVYDTLKEDEYEITIECLDCEKKVKKNFKIKSKSLEGIEKLMIKEGCI